MNQAPAPQVYVVRSTNQYERDVKRLRKSGFRIHKLDSVISTLARGERLPDKCRDHALKGGMAGYRECHIAPDWLLVYVKNNEKLVLVLIQTGTHRDVLGVE